MNKVKLEDIVKEIYDEADHIVGTEADDHKEVAVKNAEAIKKLANKALKIMETE